MDSLLFDIQQPTMVYSARETQRGLKYEERAMFCAIYMGGGGGGEGAKFWEEIYCKFMFFFSRLRRSDNAGQNYY
jgi:hypothetical protein